MSDFQVVYSEQQVSNPNQDPIHGIISPSANKPKTIADKLKETYPNLNFCLPVALGLEDFYRCHDKDYVDGIFAKTIKNGFGTYSDSVNMSLPYTNGAMFEACRIAKIDSPACALVSGFHHAGYSGFEGFGYFCTFNGLMISAFKMIEEFGVKRVAIIDCDMHYGNGTDDIIYHLDCSEQVFHYSFGKYFHHAAQSLKYLNILNPDNGLVVKKLAEFKPDLLICQSGADVHINDPMGGVLDEEQMKERDKRVFKIAKNIGVPLAWCLAGGYQVDEDGSIGTVIRLHMNTFEVC